MSKKLDNNDIALLNKIYVEYRDNQALEKLYSTKQHRTSNTYRHVCLVAKLCMHHVIKRGLHYDFNSLLRGAFLHDFFFYDWRKDKEGRHKHLTKHPERAFENAKKYFKLSEVEEDIIKNHMWPITITKFPKTKEGRLVMWEDKVATMIEFFSRKKKLLIFDMDGTISNTLDDLHNAVNYVLEKYNYPIKSKEETRKAVGNGLKVLLQKSLPKEIDNECFNKIFADFMSYYDIHKEDNTKPYDGMKETLLTLRRRGYALAVSTNKEESLARKIINKMYPNLFQYVAGDNGQRKLKPYPDSINDIMEALKVKRKSKVVYIGDSEVDYQTAKNANVECKLVTYGFRTSDELISKGIDEIEFIHDPKDLTYIFKIKQ